MIRWNLYTGRKLEESLKEKIEREKKQQQLVNMRERNDEELKTIRRKRGKVEDGKYELKT